MTEDIRLFTPGPTQLPQEVRNALSSSLIHHRSDEFRSILCDVRKRLGLLCDTTGEMVVFSSSGTGAMEACLSSFFEPKEEVVVVEAGKFGQRWVDMARHFDLNVKVVSVPWGKAVQKQEVISALTSSTKGILIQACESSTGVCHPVFEIGQALVNRKDVLFVVDGIGAIGIHDLSMERDRIDILVGSSQKGLMNPPGLAFVGLSKQAMGQLLQTERAYYFSLARELQAQRRCETCFTPAISLFIGLKAALVMIDREGKSAVFDRHRQMQKMARKALWDMGFSLLNAEEEACWGMTVAKAPPHMDVTSWLSRLRRVFGLWLADGQGKLAGKIFRLAHMGACQEGDLNWALEKIRESLEGEGWRT